MQYDNYNGEQLLMAFSRELSYSHGKKRDYTSPVLTLRGDACIYYFTHQQVKQIIQSKGSIEISFVESLYKFEEALQTYIDETVEKRPVLEYVDWVKASNLKIIIKKDDILHYSKRKGLNKVRFVA